MSARTKTTPVTEGQVRMASDSQLDLIRSLTAELAELGHAGVGEAKLGIKVIKGKAIFDSPSVYRRLVDEAGNEAWAEITSVQASRVIRALQGWAQEARPTRDNPRAAAAEAPVTLYTLDPETGQMVPMEPAAG